MNGDGGMETGRDLPEFCFSDSICVIQSTLPLLQAELRLTADLDALSPGFYSSPATKLGLSSLTLSVYQPQQLCLRSADDSSSRSPPPAPRQVTSRDPVSGVLNENTKRLRSER